MQTKEFLAMMQALEFHLEHIEKDDAYKEGFRAAMELVDSVGGAFVIREEGFQPPAIMS